MCDSYKIIKRKFISNFFLYSTILLRSVFAGLRPFRQSTEPHYSRFYTRCCPGSSHASLVRILACQIASTRLFHFPPMSGSSATSLPPRTLWFGLPFARCQPVTSDFSVSFGEGAGFEPAMSYACFTAVLGCLYPWLRPLAQPSCLRFTFFQNIILTTSCRRIVRRQCSSLSDNEDTPTASSLSFRQGVSVWLASSEGCRRI